MALDYNLLADIFPAPVKAGTHTRSASVYIDDKGRVAHMEKSGREWEGWFDDDSGMTYVADTKRELIFDMSVKLQRGGSPNGAV